MKNNKLLLLIILVLIRFSSYAQQYVKKDQASSNYNLNKPEREEWLQNAGMGMFIHFSLDAQLGVVISHTLVGASDDYVNRFYEELPRTFDPARFDPYKIAVLAKLAGMKYIVFTTKHHSGFCMWDTKTTTFNIMHTPYHKDLLKAFVEATRKAGLEVGFYFSPDDFNFYRNHHIPISRSQVHMSDSVRKEFDDYTRRQCEELMQNYGRIDVLFIDGEPKDVVKETCWKLQPDLLITRGALKTPEQMLPGVPLTDPWESCITMGTAWQYQPTNDRYKSGTRLIELLIEARSKGGSLLLNIGPEADGSMAPEQEGRLREMAAWYFVNHEAIDSVRPWVIPNEGNIWFTRSVDQKKVYAILTGLPDWPLGERKSFVLHSVKATRATAMSVLGQNSKILEYHPVADVNCRFRQTDTGLVVSLVRAQRIYDDRHWPNPVVIQLQNVLPAIEPVQVQTDSAMRIAGGLIFSGKILHYHPGAAMTARFYYRPYKGQTEDLYGGPWTASGMVAIDAHGNFKKTIVGLPKGQSYEYRAVATYSRIEINGDKKVYQP